MLSTKYLCYGCNIYKTNRFNDMKKHLCRKKACDIRKDAMLLSEDQILIMSIMPYNNNLHTLELSDLEYLANSNCINKNKNKLFDELSEIDKNNQRKCKYCNKEFSLVSSLKKHFIFNCFYINIKDTQDNETVNITNNITNNIYNTYNNCNINNNNINLYVDLKIPIPFEDDWDLSKITNKDMTSILVSNYIYSELLKEILENDINNNVILNSDNKSGFVYMNHNDKYISMKSNKIAEKTMEKLNKTINDTKGNIKDVLNNRVYKLIRNIINEKINDYHNPENKELRNNVNNLMCSIYNNKKKTSIKLAENVKINENNTKENIKQNTKENTQYIINDDDSDNEEDNSIIEKDKQKF
jgi:hypothetical protein